MPTLDEVRKFNQSLIAEFRMSGGKVSGWESLLLLTTLGARSNKPHTTPLVYSTDGDHLILVAAAVGSPKHPDWYHNLRAHPNVIIELHDKQYRMHAVIAEGKERERLFNQHAIQVPVSVEYQEMAGRQLPIVILEPISEESSGAAS